METGWSGFITDSYFLKVNIRNRWTRCEICQKLTITTPEHYQLILFWYPHCWVWSGFRPSCNVSIVDFEHIKSGWDQYDTPQCETTICLFFLHYQDGIFLLIFSTDASVASLVCLAVWFKFKILDVCFAKIAIARCTVK